MPGRSFVVAAVWIPLAESVEPVRVRDPQSSIQPNLNFDLPIVVVVESEWESWKMSSIVVDFSVDSGGPLC